jgi:hypothetical protein
MNYFKQHWDESRGDQYDNWGTSIWYFEVGTDRWITRQIEIYSNGNVLQYDKEHIGDQYGGLGDQALDEKCISSLLKIDQNEFEEIWHSRKPFNK